VILFVSAYVVRTNTYHQANRRGLCG